MSTTALIIRPKSAPKIHVLECDGPHPRFDPIINYAPRTNLPMMSFEEWCALPAHDKHPRYDTPSNQDYESACRLSRMIAAVFGNLKCRRHFEIQARLELLFPGCTGEILPTVSNL